MNQAPGRVLFYGGTFDPPHAGHVAIVRRLLSENPGSVVIVSPAAQAPLRGAGHLFSYRQRVTLLRCAFEPEIGAGRVILSVLEKSLPRPNYTWNTLQALTALCGQKPEIVIGADQAQNLHRWYRGEDLVANYEFVVFPRAGFSLQMPAGSRYKVITSFAMGESATALREELQLLPASDRFARAHELLLSTR